MVPNESFAGEEPTRKTHQTPHVSPYDLQAGPMAAARQDLIAQIKDMEGTLRYMGTVHPQRERMVRRHRQLQLLLTRWEEAQRMQQEVRTMLERHK